MLKRTNPTTASIDLAERADKWLDTVPLDDCWRLSAHTAVVARIQTSAYVDEELHFIGPPGTAEPSGLSGEVIDARPGHHVTVVRLTARNSGRERPVVLFDHDNGNVQVLDGNFAPLLRSRFEGIVLLAGLILAALCVAVGLWLIKVLPKRGRSHPSGPVFVLAGMLLPLGIVFTGKRRLRLRRSLEKTCRDVVEQLSTTGRLVSGDVSVAPAADETSPPAG